MAIEQIEAPPIRHHQTSTVTDRFRLDVQGLRALAVLLVVAYHAKLGVPGGFVGVDVFFVISGFVIGRSLHRELEQNGRLNLLAFYGRRIRRLLPAVSLVVTVTLLASIALLGFSLQRWTAATGRAGSLFMANVFLHRSGGGYFDPGDELNPLLHLWSLSVEEQFYLLLPVTLFLIWFFFRQAARLVTALVLGTMAAASLYLSYSLTADVGPLAERLDFAPRFAFYISVTRIWEFLAGIAIAFWATAVRRWPGPRLASTGRPAATGLWVVGAGAVAYSAFAFDDSTAFPGTAAVIPVAGTVALIVAGSQTPLARVLEHRTLTFIGDLSYSWYLWHWPAIVLTRNALPNDEIGPRVAAIASLLPAWLSYVYVENRFRFGMPKGPRVTAAIAAGCILIPIGIAQVVRAGAASQWGTGIDANAEAPFAESYENCHLEEMQFAAWDRQQCTWPQTAGGDPDSRGDASNDWSDSDSSNPSRTVFLVGDSHAVAVSDSVRSAADRVGLGFQAWSMGGCPFVKPPLIDDGTGCPRWQQAALEAVIQEQPELVVILNRSPVYNMAPDGELDRPMTAPDGSTPQTPDQALMAWDHSLRSILDELEDAGIPALLVMTAPDYPIDGLELRSMIYPEGLVTERSRADVERRRKEVVEVEQAVVESYDLVSVLDFVPLLCDQEVCSPVRDGQWLYFDDDHLNLDGAKTLEPELAQAIERAIGR